MRTDGEKQAALLQAEGTAQAQFPFAEAESIRHIAEAITSHQLYQFRCYRQLLYHSSHR